MKYEALIGVNDLPVENGDDIVRLVQIAMWVEYGTKVAPPRPAYRTGLDLAVRENKKNIDAYLNNVWVYSMQPQTTKADLEKLEYNLIKRIAQSAVKHIKAIIKQGSMLPNAPSTVKKKGFNHPWFETGTVLNNVNYSIEKVG